MANTGLGERIARLRLVAGLTQEQLAERSTVSVSTIRKLERQEREDCALATVRKLAAALGVTTVELFSPPAPRLDTVPEHENADFYEIRRVLRPARGLGMLALAEDDSPPDLARLELSVRTVRRMFDTNQYVAAMKALPVLLTEARAAVREADEADRKAAAALLFGAYRIAGKLLVQLRRDDLAYDALGLAMDAGHQAEDDLLVAAAVVTETWMLVRQGRFDDAERAALATAEAIEPSFARSPARQVATWGYLMLRASAAAVRNNRPDVAVETMRNAAAAAHRVEVHDIGEAAPFTPAMVAARRVENLVIVGDADKALDVAREVTSAQSTTSYNRFRLDVAAALIQRRRRSEAADQLITLHRTAPDWLRHQRYARDLTRDLVHRRARALTRELRSLSTFLDIPA